MESLSKESYLSSFHQFPSYAPLPDHIKFESVSSKKIQCSALENISPHQYDILQAPNSRALISALKTLQEKICRLELEKTHARDRLTNLTRVAGEHKKVLESEKQSAELAAKEATNQQNDIGKQLNNAKQRCSLLEKQLDYMKEMMENADTQKTTIHEHQTKIQHLEEKLSVEEQNRKALQDKAAQVRMTRKYATSLLYFQGNFAHLLLNGISIRLFAYMYCIHFMSIISSNCRQHSWEVSYMHVFKTSGGFK
ncbi:hypothetical protein XENTR_v10014100 [Xenopus tropicalis]|nr:hypothetical protein XENTR_v10014100 [Xenopus tropicalis]